MPNRIFTPDEMADLALLALIGRLNPGILSGADSTLISPLKRWIAPNGECARVRDLGFDGGLTAKQVGALIERRDQGLFAVDPAASDDDVKVAAGTAVEVLLKAKALPDGIYAIFVLGGRVVNVNVHDGLICSLYVYPSGFECWIDGSLLVADEKAVGVLDPGWSHSE